MECPAQHGVATIGSLSKGGRAHPRRKTARRTLAPVTQIAAAAHAHGAVLQVDAAQAAGKTGIDVTALGAGPRPASSPMRRSAWPDLPDAAGRGARSHDDRPREGSSGAGQRAGGRRTCSSELGVSGDVARGNDQRKAGDGRGKQKPGNGGQPGGPGAGVLRRVEHPVEAGHGRGPADG